MKLVRVSQWLDNHFAEGSKPHPKTISKWIKEKKLAGAIIAGQVFVQEDALYEHLSVTAPPKRTKADPLTVGRFRLVPTGLNKC